MSENPKKPVKESSKNPSGTGGAPAGQAGKPAPKPAPAPIKPGNLPRKPPKAPRGGKPNKGGRPVGSKDTKPRAPKTPPAPPDGGNGQPPGPPAIGPGGMPMPPSAFAELEEDKIKAARATALAIAETLGMICDNWLPPPMSKAQKEVLVAAWTPTILYYQDTLIERPWFIAAGVTLGIMGPRIGVRIGKAIAARNAPN